MWVWVHIEASTVEGVLAGLLVGGVVGDLVGVGRSVVQVAVVLVRSQAGADIVVQSEAKAAGLLVRVLVQTRFQCLLFPLPSAPPSS